MRRIETLLEIMLENTDKLKSGLCGLVWQLDDDKIINLEEHYKLLNYIESHRPFNIRTIIRSTFYWKQGRIKPRVKWLKKHIKNLNKYENN
jgi:hypothetical protein